MILTPLQKLPNNVGDLDKIIVATSIEWLPKVQIIAKSGHTAPALTTGIGDLSYITFINRVNRGLLRLYKAPFLKHIDWEEN